MRKCLIDRDNLQELYINQKLSANEIGPLKNCDSQTILNYLRRYGIPVRSRLQGMANHFKTHPEKPWPGSKGGRIEHNGYIYIRQVNHPYARNGYVAEHRLVMEKKLGRYLLPSEKVHHKGTKFPLGSLENKSDNRDENLILVTKHYHQIMEELCQQCKLAKEIRLLRWQVKELIVANQLKLKEELQ